MGPVSFTRFVSFRFVSPKRNETKRRGSENHRNETKRRDFENHRNGAKRNETAIRFGLFRSGPFRLSVRRSAFENSTGSQVSKVASVAKVASHPPFSAPWSITYLLSYRKLETAKQTGPTPVATNEQVLARELG